MFEINHHDQLDKLSEAFGRLMTRSLSNTENRKQIIDHHESESQYPINFYVNSKILDPQNKKLIQNLKRKKISTQKIIDKFFQQFRQEISSQKSY